MKVKGVRGLRVAVASVIPKITSGVTSSVAMAMAENTADLIKGKKRYRTKGNSKKHTCCSSNYTRRWLMNFQLLKKIYQILKPNLLIICEAAGET